MTRQVVALGIDPGASASVAAVALRRGERPALLHVSSVYGSSWARWHDRATSAIAECVAQGQRHLLQDGVSRPVLGGWIELPPFAVTRGRRLAGDSRGMRSWHGMGVRSGWLRCLAQQAGVDLGEIPVADWTRLIRVRSGKVRLRSGPAVDGWHRVLEAGQLVVGAEAELQRRTTAADGEAALERVVCSAESVLIAAACAIHTTGTDLRVQPELRRPAAQRGTP